NFSISPRLLLAIIEYQSQALTQPGNPPSADEYVLGYRDPYHRGLYRQLSWLANYLNDGYYRWRIGKLDSIERADSSIEYPDPWQNAATVALQNYFAYFYSGDEYFMAIHAQGLLETYTSLFGNPWTNPQPHIPGSLEQPRLNLPFEPGKPWTLTGGPHTAWGEGQPYAAIDFAPPSISAGCAQSAEWATAVADGIVVRTGVGYAMLDLDGDGDERTGWVILYLHLQTDSIPPVGTRLLSGQPIGHPSCEGGEATGTHVHIARKYNGEWMIADGPLAFNLEGWLARSDGTAYQGSLINFSREVRACECSDKASQIISEIRN
ncbi:MAG: M23 family metallopeptidase, partial [Chloroflexi bacterium]|nr:M23 family metallopeptidase [Chloroflexota bacterium]